MTIEALEDTLPDVGMMPEAESPAPAPVATEPKMTAAEVINAEEFYSLNEIYCRLGINANTVQNALNSMRTAGDKSKRHYFTEVRGSGGGWTEQVLGRQLLAWIEGERIAYDVDRLLATNTRRAQARKAAAAAEDAAAKAAKEPVPGNLLDEVAKIQSDQQRDQQQCDQSNAAAYVAIILREWPDPADARTLAYMIEDGFTTKEQIERDQKIAKRARELAAEHDQFPGADEQRKELQRLHTELVERHKAEFMASEKQARHAASLAAQFSQAAWELEKLRRQSQKLFDDGNPPRLRTVAT